MSSSLNNLLISLTKELQQLDSLSHFHLAGGTNLSIRYNHRKSVDIDLMSSQVVGKTGLITIHDEIVAKFAHVRGSIIEAGINEQYSFLRLFISQKEHIIKTEIIQNVQTLYEPQVMEGVRLLSVSDIGVLKLHSASSRMAKKDIYDLDYITDELSLEKLMDALKKKQLIYSEEKFENIFDLDQSVDPLKSPAVLLEFDQVQRRGVKDRPSHSHDRIDIIEGNKNWLSAKASWRRKVKEYCSTHNIKLPKLRHPD